MFYPVHCTGAQFQSVCLARKTRRQPPDRYLPVSQCTVGAMLDIQGVFTSLAICCFVASLMLWAGQRYWDAHTGKQPVDTLTGR